MQTQYNNKGVLFPNKRKQGNQPDWQGKLTIDGKEDRLSGWIKQDKNGEMFISLARTPHEQVEAFRKSPDAPFIAPERKDKDNNEDRIPF